MTTYTLAEEAAYKMGAKGADPTEAERLLFEAWMRGHCWAVIGEWTGTQYMHPKEGNGFVHEGAMATRRLWAAWRDRAALQPNTQEPTVWYPTEYAIAALKRFEETCADNEGYDVPKDTMRNLQAIGLIYRTYGDMYCITDFGQSILTAHGVKP